MMIDIYKVKLIGKTIFSLFVFLEVNSMYKEVNLSRITTTKGELVEHPQETDFAAQGKKLKNNPHKTPPNNLTNKRKEAEEKG